MLSLLDSINSWDESLHWYGCFQGVKIVPVSGSPFRKCVTGKLYQLNHQVYVGIKLRLVFNNPLYLLPTGRLYSGGMK